MFLSAEKISKCKTCGNTFEKKINVRQIFCGRSCRVKSYRKAKKISTFPNYSCPSCGVTSQLDFYPKKSPFKWSNFQCSICGHFKENDDYYLIKEIKDGMRED